MVKTKYMTMDQIAATLMSDACKTTENRYQSNFMCNCDIFEIEIKNNNDLLKHLQKAKCNHPDFNKLVSQFEQALSEKTPESKEFVKNITLFINAFNSNLTDKDINKTWKALFKKLNDKKLQYIATKVFEDLTVGGESFETTIVQKLCATNPHATANDILWYCVYNRMFMDAPLFKKGLQKLDIEFEQETKQDKPNFGKWSHIFDLIRENYIDNKWIEVNKDKEKLDFLAKFSNTAIDMRIRIAKLEQENEKLKKIKTAKLKAGIANVVKKSTPTKSATSKTK